jgi:class 3 adenylate cyclase
LGLSRHAGRRRPAPSGIVTILFTDFVGWSEQIDKLGDAASDRVRRKYFALLRNAVRTHRGAEVKTLGDGLMATFPSAIDAVNCAITMQHAVDRNPPSSGAPLAMRIGLHTGEPIHDQEDYFGRAVIVARRLCDQAAGGQIIASATVRSIAGSSGRFTFGERRDLELKGMAAPIGMFEVLWEASDPVAEDDLGPSTISRFRLTRNIAAAVVVAAIAAVIALPNGEDGDPSGPPADEPSGPPDLDLVVDDRGWINSSTGRAVITGSLTCTRPARVVVTVNLVQGELASPEETSVHCTDEETWQVTVPGPFVAGELGIDAEARSSGFGVSSLPVSTSLETRSCTRLGTPGADNSFKGTTGDDALCGLSGNDRIFGGPGNDELRAYDGHDVVRGEEGNDLLTGGLGADLLVGGPGSDRLLGDSGRDRLKGGPGADTCVDDPDDRVVAC